jgi:hypothetical protein
MRSTLRQKEVSALTAKHRGSPVLRWGRAKVVELFGADLRLLAALHIVLALLVLGDILSRGTVLYAHYTDYGILPRTALIGEVLSPWAASLNLMNGGASFQALLFAVASLAALGLLVGYRTGLMNVIVWVFLISVQWRNPLLNGSGEDLLRMLLFWGMFLPLGAYWSVDREAPGWSFAVVDALPVHGHGRLTHADRFHVLVYRAPKVRPRVARRGHRYLLRFEHRPDRHPDWIFSVAIPYTARSANVRHHRA